MEGYPQSLAELEAGFPTEGACLEYLAQLRWPNGFRCPRCQGSRAWMTRRSLRTCADCGHETSPTAGTIFHRTHTPLTVWFRAIWWLTSQKAGASAMGLKRLLGLRSYQTAWTCLHKLRRAMVRPGRDALTGRVEVDETFVGGVEPGQGKRHIGKKALVLVAAEVRRRGTGRIRLARIYGSTKEAIVPVVRTLVAPGSTLVTDGLPSYAGLCPFGYGHEVRVIQGSGREANELLPRVHRVASLLKRWLLGTHQGGVRRENLEYYLDEFTFRFNRRTSRNPGNLFRRLLEQAVIIEPTTYATIRKGLWRRKTKPKHKP